ncbi:uncharacterized protein LOC111084012, partial [Limulus polyphemus]|uniref:Uncharacterized protein LOC111084012 n=1 Tax=Limulus polyphemus TaxID=6850 RepID=A0ABM1RYP0_LIMPO
MQSQRRSIALSKLPYLPPSLEETSATDVRHRKDRRRNLSVGCCPLLVQERSQFRPLTQRTSSLEEDVMNSLSYEVTTPDYIPTHSSSETYKNHPWDSLSRNMSKNCVHRSAKTTAREAVQQEGLVTSLPSYMYTLKQRLREELLTVRDERKRLAELTEKGRDLGLRHKSDTDIAFLLPPSAYLDDMFSQLRVRSGPVRTISTSAQTSPQDREGGFYLQHSSSYTMGDKIPGLLHSRTFESSLGKTLQDGGSWYTETLDKRFPGYHHHRHSNSSTEDSQNLFDLHMKETSDNITLSNHYQRRRTR